MSRDEVLDYLTTQIDLYFANEQTWVSALPYLTKTGMLSGKLLFTSNSGRLGVVNLISSCSNGIAPSMFILSP